MISYYRFVIKFDEIKDLAAIYFKDEGRDVQLSYTTDDDGEPILKAIETVSFDDVTTTAERVMTDDEIEEILYIFFGRAGYEVGDVVSYGAEGTTVLDGTSFVEVTKKEAHQFIVKTRKIENNKTI